MFKQLYLSKAISELTSEDINLYISPLTIHNYIQNKFLTCTREVGDPILSQNIDLKYVVPKAKSGKKMQKKTLTMFQEVWHHFLRVYVQAEVTHDT